MPSDAIRHALAAGDFGRAAALIELTARAMLLGRQEQTFLGWLRALPDEEIRRRPVLGVYYALALVSHDLEAGEARLRDAERLLDDTTHTSEIVVVDEEEFRALPGIAAITRAYYAGAIGDVSGSVRHARRALDLLEEDEPLWRGAAATLLGLGVLAAGALPHVATALFSDLYHAPGATPEVQATLVLSWQATQAIFDSLLVVGLVVLPPGLIALGIAMVGSPAFGKGFGRASAALGLVGGVAACVLLVNPASPIAVVGIFTSSSISSWDGKSTVYRGTL